MQYHHDPPWVTLRLRSRPVTLGSRSRNKKFCVKSLVKVFIGLHLLIMLMDQIRDIYRFIFISDQIDTLHDGRCWSEVLCRAITTHLGDHEV